MYYNFNYYIIQFVVRKINSKMVKSGMGVLTERGNGDVAVS
jgi:hypothetical protein